MRMGDLAMDRTAQGSLEYALTVVAILSLVVGVGALWRFGQRGALSELAMDATSHQLEGEGYADIALY